MVKRASDKKLPTGVRFVGSSIEINFQVRGERYQTTLPLPQTPAGTSAAQKIRAELISKAKLGILTDADFAEAKGLEVVRVSDEVLFQDYAQKYLKHGNQANGDTKSGYLGMLQNKWMPIFALMPIGSITPTMLREAIDDYGFESAKTKNNNLTPLRGVFELAVQDDVIDKNPMDVIKNDKVQEEDPDPFTKAEMEALLTWLEANMTGENEVYYNYYELAFWTGCRPSELLALHWKSDYDKFNQTLLISKSRVRGIEKKVTKTHTVRTIHLNKRAISALERQYKLTNERDHIFICPTTNEAFFNEKPPRLRLQEAMQATGIRERRAYNTRHTYATILLTSGVNPYFAANQMGHSLQMMLKRYAKWIDMDKSKSEIAKLDLD